MSLIYQADPVGPGQRRPGLYLGGKADAKDLEKLERWNVTHILNVTPSREAHLQLGVPNYFESKKDRFTYKRIVVYDDATGASIIKDAADAIVSFIAAGLCRGGSVLVHCQRGISRSTTAVLFYLMRRAKMPLEEALALVKRRRPEVEPIPAFLRVLEEYQEICRSLGFLETEPQSSQKKALELSKKRGPTMPSLDNGSSTERDEPNKRPKTAVENEPTEASSGRRQEKASSVIGPMLPPLPLIGPSMPPSVMIGPSLPPSADEDPRRV